jgi:hypothetical protein
LISTSRSIAGGAISYICRGCASVSHIVIAQRLSVLYAPLAWT